MPSHILHAWKDSRVADRFHTGISLHSHTSHSRDDLAFLARHARRHAISAALLRLCERRFLGAAGPALDYSRVWWTPPLPAADAFQLEFQQIDNLGLTPLVSITDHDSIAACLQLHVLGKPTPVSVEWTVPYGASFLHIGVHNLPLNDAPDWMRLFAFWTARPDPTVLRDILAGIHALPGVLTVVNHPFWDEGGIGPDGQIAMVRNFIAAYKPFLHALELNGLRSWRENQQVARIAAELGLPLVSGGDRHGCEPNANLNLSNASTFAEFAAGIRDGAPSHIFFMPQYREHHQIRCLEAISDTLREYPEYPGRQFWTDRCFYADTSGRVQSFTERWKDAAVGRTGNVTAALRVFQKQSVRNAIRFAVAHRQEEAAG